MEYLTLKKIGKKASKIGIGTQPFGSHSEKEGRQTLQKAFEQHINFLDTAWIYGHGRSEKIIGNTLKDYDREELIIETKIGLQIVHGKTVRDSRKETLKDQLLTSLDRLQTDYVDILYIHWPDPNISFQQTAEVLEEFKEEGHTLSIGLSNYTSDQLKHHQQKGSVTAVQNPYNIFERGIENELIPYIQNQQIPLMAYRPLCQGLFTGKYHKGQRFPDHEVKKDDPKFKYPYFSQYLDAVEQLKKLAQEGVDKTVLELAVRWVLDTKNTIALWGAWKPEYIEEVDGIFGWSLDPDTKQEIDVIVNKTIQDPVGPEFLAPNFRTEEITPSSR